MENKNTIDLSKVDKEVLAYLESLLDRKGMGDLPESILADMLMDLYLRFEKFVLISIMQGISQDEYDKVNSFLEENNDPVEIGNFLRENVADIQSITGRAMEDFERIYLGENNK